ncbi:MAG: hypothetical protein IPP50_13935 [Piscinibacter sp.]|nr:hypothetical protein [Piscinibacter sp.]
MHAAEQRHRTARGAAAAALDLGDRFPSTNSWRSFSATTGKVALRPMSSRTKGLFAATNALSTSSTFDAMTEVSVKALDVDPLFGETSKIHVLGSLPKKWIPVSTVLRPFVAITPSNPLSTNAMSPHRIRSFDLPACHPGRPGPSTACGGGEAPRHHRAPTTCSSVSASGGAGGVGAGRHRLRADRTSRFAPTASVTPDRDGGYRARVQWMGRRLRRHRGDMHRDQQAARTVTAGFNAPPRTDLHPERGRDRGGTLRSQPAGIDCGATCSAAFTSGATRVCTSATPAAGQVLSGWGGACTGAGTTCTVTMNQARSVSVVFSAAPPVQRTLSVSLTETAPVRSQPVGVDCGVACSASFGDGTQRRPDRNARDRAAVLGLVRRLCRAWRPARWPCLQDRSVGATFAGGASAAPAWQTPLLLEASEDFDVTTRVLTAVSPVGDAIVMWSSPTACPTAAPCKVFSRRYAAGQGWDAAVVVPNLSRTRHAAAARGQVLMDAAGTATWLRPNLETAASRRLAAGCSFRAAASQRWLLTSAVMDATEPSAC